MHIQPQMCSRCIRRVHSRSLIWEYRASEDCDYKGYSLSLTRFDLHTGAMHPLLMSSGSVGCAHCYMTDLQGESRHGWLL